MRWETFISGVINRLLAWGCFTPQRPQALGLTWACPGCGAERRGGGVSVSPTPTVCMGVGQFLTWRLAGSSAPLPWAVRGVRWRTEWF